MAISLLLLLMLAGNTSCNPFRGEEEVSQQLTKVVRGDLAITVSGSGNIEISHETKLAFGVGGRVEEILVEEGDKVSKGEKLAKLETHTLELALRQAKVAETQAQVAVIQAQVVLETAEYNLEKAQDKYTWPDVEIAQSEVDDAKAYLEYALSSQVKATTAEARETWANVVARTQASLAAVEVKLKALLTGADTREIAIKRLQAEAARQSLDLAGQSLEQAKQVVVASQKQLDEAVIIAPFDGVVANVSVKEKDTVTTVTTIIHLIDPSRMELNVAVDEIDIPEVQVGQRVIIEVDALPNMTLEGKVSYIGLLPRKEAGVILFEVKIELDTTDGIGLRGGMSASADIIITERSNVLLVPNRAIKQDSQGNTIVEVAASEQIKERTVVTGISDGFQTEIVDGLKEGEVVVEKRARS